MANPINFTNCNITFNQPFVGQSELVSQLPSCNQVTSEGSYDPHAAEQNYQLALTYPDTNEVNPGYGYAIEQQRHNPNEVDPAYVEYLDNC